MVEESVSLDKAYQLFFNIILYQWVSGNTNIRVFMQTCDHSYINKLSAPLKSQAAWNHEQVSYGNN